MYKHVQKYWNLKLHHFYSIYFSIYKFLILTIQVPNHELKGRQLFFSPRLSLFNWDQMRPSRPASRCVWPQEHLLHDNKRWTRITGLVRITNCVNVRWQLVKCQWSFQSLYLSSTWGWPTFIPADRRPPHASGAFDLLIFSKNLKTSFCQSAQSQIILLPPPIQLPSSTLSLLHSHTI